MESLLLVVSTFPDAASARQIGTLLVERQLAACVNLVPAVTAGREIWKILTPSPLSHV